MWWFVGGLAAGLLALFAYRAVVARRFRELTARIEKLAGGGEPASPSDTQAAAAFQAARRMADAKVAAEHATRQREHLMRSALDAAPSAIVLFSDLGKIAFANGAAQDLFFEGQNPHGENFIAMLGRAPDTLRRALSGDGGELFSIEDSDGERQTYHLSKQRFAIDGENLVLVLVKNLTHEIRRQEADAWKRMIRLFCHELNNSLAPVSSLVHSARVMVTGTPVAPKLEKVFATIGERTDHLRSFLEGYAQFARLPLPRRTDVAWKPFVDRLLALYPHVTLVGELPSEPGWFDAAQLEQVLVNLLKNATEAGGPPAAITLAITELGAKGTRVTVADRGAGMSPEVLERALVPFYSTKERGSGLGLTLSREIVEAHGGTLRLENRPDGGLAVHVRLLAKHGAPEMTGKLTLTRS
jgi:nitrogen fixation/metabolism regulation signal transduction histidine kinase